MSDEKQKNYKQEWSFSFDRIGESIRKVIGEVREAANDVEPEEIQFASFSEALAGRDRASVFIRFSTGLNTINPLVASENLIEADVNYVGEIEFVVEDDPTKPTVVLRQLDNSLKRTVKTARGVMGDKDELRWDVRLSPDVPLHLNVNGGVGKMELNLAGLNLTQFDYQSGVGAAEITLPLGESRYAADVEAGVGSTTLTLLEGSDVDLDISGGVGRTRIVIPPNAAVRVEAAVGVGGLNVPGHFNKEEGARHLIGERGIWQTENYESAERRIDITFEGGIGKFEVVAEAQVV